MENEEIRIINVDDGNIGTEHICCAIGDDKVNRARAQCKKDWLKQRLPEGHVFKKADVRGKVFIEYVPAEYAWFPVNAPGYFFIQCFWASGRYQGMGLGSRLIAECEKDARDSGKSGLTVIASAKKTPFMVDRKYYESKGFEVCDSAENGFLLMMKSWDKSAPVPEFTADARKAAIPGSKGLVIYASDLCPFVPEYAGRMAEIARQEGFPVELKKVEHLKAAKALPTPWGIFSLFYDGKFISHEPMADKKFRELLVKLAG